MNEPEIIEAEVLDEQGRPIMPGQAAVPPRDHARPQGDLSGVLGGFMVLAAGILMTVLVAFFTVFIVCPLLLLGRILGFSSRRFRS